MSFLIGDTDIVTFKDSKKIYFLIACSNSVRIYRYTEKETRVKQAKKKKINRETNEIACGALKTKKKIARKRERERKRKYRDYTIPKGEATVPGSGKPAINLYTPLRSCGKRVSSNARHVFRDTRSSVAATICLIYRRPRHSANRGAATPPPPPPSACNR